MADEFLDLFTQLFYSTEAWGYLGVILIVVIPSLSLAAKIKYSWIFLTLFQILTVINYVNAGTSYTWHIVILVFSAVFTVVVGNKSQ